MSESIFSKADSSVYSEFLDLVEKVFPELSGFSFGLLFRSKMKKSRGNLVLAEICLPTKLMSFFAKNDAGNPYDYLMIIDEMAWACATAADRTRIVRHELRHVFVDEKGNPKLVDHDFADFHIEVELNSDAPMWGSNLAEVTMAGYKQVKDGQKDPRQNRADAEDLKPVTKEPQRQTQIESAIKSGVKKGMNDLKGKAGDIPLKTASQRARDKYFDRSKSVMENLEDKGLVKPTGGIDSLEDVYVDDGGTGDFVPNPTINTGKSLEEIAKEKGLLGETA